MANLHFSSPLFLALSFIALGSCKSDGILKDPLFEEVSARESGIRFENTLSFDANFNIYTYRNFYNGGGVGIGDVNQDGLMDIYLTANMLPNRLYLNKGNFTFEDISGQAGVAGTRSWSTGVSMADVNGDGLLDIYVCNSGDIKGDNKQNELFINLGNDEKGVPRFREEAEKFGLADRGFSTHAAFFDYDKDGDLDMYLLNNSYQAIGSFNLSKNERPNRDPVGGDKLFRNDGNRFTDVSAKAGIYGSIIGFGLGVTVGDVDRDGWLDIFISNDFFERDYLYLNNGDGTFRETLESAMRSISAASMGADMADINNDGFPDIFVTDMLPREDARLKTVTTFDNWDRYQLNVQNDYWHQFTRNTLHLNNGDRTFSEIGRLCDVAATDWSWGALIFDFQNDGLKDLFVANGIYQDLTDQDYLKFVTEENTVYQILSKKEEAYRKLVELIPSQPVPNHAFVNKGNLDFQDQAVALGLGRPGFSNGSAYGDLDNDGDLDLVVNNVNMPLSLYRNQSRQRDQDHHFLTLDLRGAKGNTQAVGTRITAVAGKKRFYVEQVPIRGFQSSVDPRPHLGLGKISVLDTLLVEWPNDRVTLLTQVSLNQKITLNQNDAGSGRLTSTLGGDLSGKVFHEAFPDFLFHLRHEENPYVDFDRDRLVFHMLSSEGPCLCRGDLNGDQRDDLYLGGAAGKPGTLLFQQADGSFRPAQESLFLEDKDSEDTDCAIFDADGDGRNDLYVCSGSNEVSNSSPTLADRLYLNSGKGRLSKSDQILPAYQFESTSCVEPSDFDSDGDLDLFVGVRSLPFYYGFPGNGYLLQNDGKGRFSDITSSWLPALREIGMVTDAVWIDYNRDGLQDLLVLGEYMPLRLFRNTGNTFTEVTESAGFGPSIGWWHTAVVADLNHDGYPDILAGNHGLNSRFRASPEKPIQLYIADFDQNGTVEPILCQYNGEKSYPLILRHDLVAQMPGLKKKYLKYKNYRNQQITDIFEPDILRNARILEANALKTSAWLNDGNGKFRKISLPEEAQFSPVYAIAAEDFSGDGHMDILLGGNLHRVKPEAGRYDASYGTYLQGDGKGGFQYIPGRISGLHLQGQVRRFVLTGNQGPRRLWVAQNNGPAQLFNLPSLRN